MRNGEIHSCPELMDYIQKVGFLPLLDSGIRGYSAEDVVDEDNRYVVFDGKFFAGKAGFVSKEWWPDLCNYRRASRPAPAEGSIEEAILLTLAEHGSLITRELRAACGFDGPKMRSKFDGYVTRLQMACRIVTEDFVYPTDKHGREYGWGWSLLTTPESLLGRDMCQAYPPNPGLTPNPSPNGEGNFEWRGRTPQESFERMKAHLSKLLPEATEKQIEKLIR